MYTMRPAGSALETGLLDFVATLPAECRMAEIGCYAGESTRLFLTTVAHVDAVDPWEDYVEAVSMTQMDAVEHVFDELLAAYPDRITKWKGRSTDIAPQLPLASLDLVYLDGNHQYDAVAADLRAWAPIVKPGGLLAGHDYDPRRPGVIRAVREYLGPPDAIFADGTWVKRVPLEAV